tara:strand:+ start:114 stop:446 length:333 start_codon:yes stop_codon:yes gene_type:complete
MADKVADGKLFPWQMLNLPITMSTETRTEESQETMTGSHHKTDHDRLVRIEETVAHQEQLLGQLNESLTQLRDQYDRLENKLDRASTQVQWLMENSHPGDDLPHEKPPHY